MQRYLGFLLAFFLIFVSCGLSENEVQGTVFIVTNGADNIKLGLVKVSAIPEREIAKFVDDKKLAVNNAAMSLKSDIDALKPQVEQSQKEVDEATKAYESAKAQNTSLKARSETLNLNFVPYIPEISTYDTEDEAAAKIIEIGKQRDMAKQLEGLRKQVAVSDAKLTKLDSAKTEAEKRLAERKTAASALQEKIKGFTNATFLLDGIPEGSAKAVTDADGKFFFKLPAGKYAFVASAHRRTGLSTEDYNWLVWVDVNKEGSKQVTLSNQNTVGENVDESVFKMNELLPLLENQPDKSSEVNLKV